MSSEEQLPPSGEQEEAPVAESVAETESRLRKILYRFQSLSLEAKVTLLITVGVAVIGGVWSVASWLLNYQQNEIHFQATQFHASSTPFTTNATLQAGPDGVHVVSSNLYVLIKNVGGQDSRVPAKLW